MKVVISGTEKQYGHNDHIVFLDVRHLNLSVDNIQSLCYNGLVPDEGTEMEDVQNGYQKSNVKNGSQIHNVKNGMV